MWSILAYALIVLVALGVSYALGLWNGALYIPTDRRRVEAMLDAAELSEGDRLVDLGSGDGRLVIAAAQRGVPSVGYEVNPFLVWLSRRQAKRAGVGTLAHFELCDFWNVDLSGFNVVTVFGISRIMQRLEQKLEHELRPGSRVVCNLFPLPNWSGERSDGIFRYRR